MFSGGLPSILSNYSTLKELSLSENQLDGKINQSFIQLMKLTYINLYSNNFSGRWDLDTLLSSLPGLRVLIDLSYSGLSIEASNTTGYVSTTLNVLYLASCNLTIFPGSLQGMKSLTYLDLSVNYIQGEIPNWVGEIGGNWLFYLDLSYNSITRLPLYQWDDLQYLFLHSNQIGQFPSSICKMSNLAYLDMSNNRLCGMIPQCIGNILSHLEVINMRNNSFHGTIPNVNMEYCGLKLLILSGNRLEDDVPSFLSKCYNMNVLDIGNNFLNGTFPRWLENLSYLQVLVLKSNSLHGFIKTSSKVVKPFSSLQILDLTPNGLLGHLPLKFFQKLHAMKDEVISDQKPQYMEFGGYPHSLTIEVKGHQQFFSKINVQYTIIDLSNNKFVGEIPVVMGNLKSLVALNLSHNNLNGRIPYALGNLSVIESLDLSWNQLEGEIPQSLVDIKFLAVLNLSQNHLVGRIPNGKQFDTFGETSFGGNLGLCGHPLRQLCEPTSSKKLLENDGDEEESKFTWKEVMLGYGCGTIIGFVMGYFMLLTGKPNWFNAIADEMEHIVLKKQKRRRYVYIGK